MLNALSVRFFGHWSVYRLLALLALGTLAHTASAAVLSLDSVTRLSTTSQANLSNGITDWAYWAPTTSGLATPVAPNNRKLNGSIISSLDKVGGSSLRGSSTAATVEQYTYTDGTNPTSATNASLAGLIFNSDIGTTNGNGKGVSLTLTGDPNIPRVANLYFGGFGATGVLTLTLNGATTVIDSSQIFTSISPKHIAIYSVRYQPDSASDLLSIQYTASAITDTANGHVGAQAVTVAVPEPAAISLAAVSLLLLTRRRR
jgi:hypothetical protein